MIEIGLQFKQNFTKRIKDTYKVISIDNVNNTVTIQVTNGLDKIHSEIWNLKVTELAFINGDYLPIGDN